MEISPIGIFYCDSVERYSQPHQPQDTLNKTGTIKLNDGLNFEAALEDLIGFEKIWLIFCFHKSHNWKPKVSPPRSPDQKRGLFSTRSPHRPNSIGMSCVNLIDIKQRKLVVAHHDLLNETPILDIKPYLPYCDAHPTAKAGWVDEVHESSFEVSWSSLANKQKQWLISQNINILELIESTLKFYPYENPKKRIKKLDQKPTYELAVKTWRVHYSLDDKTSQVQVLSFFSGYDQETLEGHKSSKWDDVPIHRKFIQEFSHE